MPRILELLGFLLAVPAWPQAPAPGPEWRFSQEAVVAGEGWIKLALPLETVGAARPDLADLRLRDSHGEEISYLIERPVRRAPELVGLQDIRLSMNKGATVVTGLVPPASRDYDALLLRTPAPEFLKAVTLEVSDDGVSWRTVVASYPIFRRPGEGESAAFEFKRSAAPYVRVTLDDALTPPIPVEGVSLYTGAREAPGLSVSRLAILQNASDSRQTELLLSLPAEHLLLNSVILETDDPAFSRPVSVLAKVFSEGDMKEAPLGSGTVWRLSGRERLAVPVRAQAPGTSLVLRVANGDNRPLSIRGVQAEVIASALIFHAPRAGSYRLWSGHAGASKPEYDVAALRERMKETAFGTAELGPLTPNDAFRPPEALPGVAPEGGALDVSSWRLRKAVSAAPQALQRLELDLEVLGHARRDFADLRLMREGVQIPYILDAGGVSRILKPVVKEAAEAPKGLLSRGTAAPPARSWTLDFPLAGLPVTRLRCAAKAGVFSRRVRLFEDRTDERGDIGRRLLAETQWVGPASGGDLTLELGGARLQPA